MKNFTNNFKQFTSRLSARWLIMALMLLVGTSAMLAANTTQSDGSYRLYFKFSSGSNWWNGSGCYHYAWVWANGGAGQVQRIYKVGTTNNASTGNTTDVFYMNIPNGMTLYGMILFRGKDAGPSNGSTTFPDNYHNKTNDIILPNNISTYNLVTAVTENSGNVTQSSRYTTISTATATLSASGYKSGSGTQADPYVYDENGTMKLTASATIDDHNFQIQLSYGSSTATIASGASKSIDVSLTTAQSATAYAVTYTPLLGGNASYKGTATTKTIYYKTAASCTNPSNPSIAIDNAKVCNGASATITVTGTAEQFQLYTVSNGTYTAVGNKQEDKTFTVSEAKTYAVKAFNGTCESADYSNTVSLTLETPSKIELASNPTICDGTEITLANYVKNTTVGTVTWYSNSGLTQVADATVTPRNSGTASAKFYYYAVAKNGVCDATAAATLTVTVDPQSKLTLKNTEITICSGTTIAFPDQVDNANTVGTVTWYTDSNMSKSAGTTVTPNATNIYYAKAVSGTCSAATAQLKVNVNNKPAKPTIQSDKTITDGNIGLVSGETVTLSVAEKAGETYTWYRGQGNIVHTGANYNTKVAGTYTVVAENNCGKSDASDAVEITVCEPITGLSWEITNGEKEVYCPGDVVYFTMTYQGNTAVGFEWIGNYGTLQGGGIYSGVVYNMTIPNRDSDVQMKLIDCSGEPHYTTKLEFPIAASPATPTMELSATKVGQGKTTVLTIGNYDANFTYTLYNGSTKVQDITSTTTTITVPSTVGTATYTVKVVSPVCDNLTAEASFTIEVQEAGVKIIQLGDLKLYTNIITDFVPMYVQKDGIVDVAGATAVKGYTWQFSANGTSDWANCTTNYADKAVGMTNGTAACNNWRADKVGYYRCLISYEGSNETQTSNALQVTGTTGTAPAINAFANFDMPVISINTGSNSLPDECSVVGKNYPSTNIDGMKKKISVDVRIYNPDGTLQYDRKGRINYRGSSSLNFKKKSYAFVTGKEKTKNSDGDVDTGKANLFGLSDGAKDKDWVLYAATPDPSMMRNRLVFDLYKEMTGKWGVNSMYVELIINNEYKGVYVLMDKITMNEKRVNITDYNGFIVKFDKTDKVDRVENTEGDQKTFATTRTGKKDITTYDTKVDQLFEIEYPEKEDIEDEGGNWTSVYKIIQERFEEFETALYNKEYEKVRQLIDYNSWADWFIINEYTKNLDAYRASCLFVYNGDKIEAQPLWDQELSFNNVTANISAKNAHSTDGLLIKDSGVYSDNFKAPFWFTGGGTNITGGLLNDPCFVSTVKSKWAAYTAEGGVLTTANISKKVAAFAEELDDAIDRENAMLPFNDNTAAGRGATSSCTGSKAMGYYGYGENCGAATTHEGSKGAITTWITNRIPKLTAELDKLTGQALIFILSPANAETTPWKGVNINVQAPEGYEYTLSHDELDADGAIISESGHMLNIRIPRPSDWGTGGNGTAHSKQYNVKATIEVSGENACGTVDNNEATANIILMDVTEDCDPEIVKK